jgi:hypothetical protein
LTFRPPSNLYSRSGNPQGEFAKGTNKHQCYSPL